MEPLKDYLTKEGWKRDWKKTRFGKLGDDFYSGGTELFGMGLFFYGAFFRDMHAVALGLSFGMIGASNNRNYRKIKVLEDKIKQLED